MSAPRGPSAALRERILAKTREAPSPTRAEVAERRSVLVLGAFVPAMAVLAATGLGPKGRPVELAIFVAVAWGTVAMASTSLVLGARSPLGPSRPRLVLVAALAPVCELVLAMLGAFLFPDSWSGILGPKNHGTCMALALVMGAAPLGAMLHHLRGLDPVDPRARGAALGAAAGAWAGTGTMLLCPHNGVLHLLVGHVGPVLLFVFVGIVLGGRILRTRAAAPR